jgi:hypothetical protein
MYSDVSPVYTLRYDPHRYKSSLVNSFDNFQPSCQIPDLLGFFWRNSEKIRLTNSNSVCVWLFSVDLDGQAWAQMDPYCSKSFEKLHPHDLSAI